ncbi:MAG: SAM-dependent methyltransferase [Gammaproteobacteria bacterium]
MSTSRDAGHFDRLYQSNPDPWGFRTSAYEQAKYAATLSALGDGKFRSGLEVGCSIGVLTRLLAPRCEQMMGIDIVEAPLREARAWCADMPHVRFERMQVPGTWPAGRFDLIVLSEVLYFLSSDDIGRCADRVRSCLLPRASVVLVNWLGQTDDPTPGMAAAEQFIRATDGALVPALRTWDEGYRLDLLRAR